MLTVLGGLAEFERHLILARTKEGRERAKARGVRFGRKLKLTPHQRREALARREAGEALTDIARTFGVSHSTISRLAGVDFYAIAPSKLRAGWSNTLALEVEGGFGLIRYRLARKEFCSKQCLERALAEREAAGLRLQRVARPPQSH